MIDITTLCDNLNCLSSDYGILTGTFPLENPAIKASFVSRGIITSMELTELDDDARELKSRMEKDAKKKKYRETPRRRHEDLRKELESRFHDLVKKLTEFKAHLEATFQFKYLPKCSYRLLGEVGKPPQQPIGLPRITPQPHNTHNGAFAAGAAPSAHRQVNLSEDATIQPPSPAVDPVDLSSLETLDNRIQSTRASKISKQPMKQVKTTRPGRSVSSTAAKSSRPRRLVTMGIAGKIAKTVLDPQDFDHPFGTLAPEVKNSQQIWEHRFPNGYSQHDPAAEYTRTLEQMLAASNKTIRMMSKTKIGKELNKAKARSQQLTIELVKLRDQNTELNDEKKEQVDMQEPHVHGTTKNKADPPYRTLLPDHKPNNKRNHHYDEFAPKDDSANDDAPDSNTTAKRRRGSLRSPGLGGVTGPLGEMLSI